MRRILKNYFKTDKKRFNSYLFERQLPKKSLAEKDHPCDPKEDDVVPRLQKRSRIEDVEIISSVGPSEDGEWEEAGGEPSIEDVLVLTQRDLGLVHHELLGRLLQGVLLRTA